MTQETPQYWWKGAVIYQIYPRSFQDTSSNGIGDLAGITSRLSYIKELGVDAIWISPFFTSPMKDFGYDVSDYRDVDPLFGTLDDFKILVEEAHKHNLKVLIDQVLSHTSDEHPWFTESRQDKTNSKADWYVWVDPEEDGSVPNNWLSVFGGSSWQWDTRRCQYYLHNFLKEQPDLNFHNPEVVKAQLNNLKFWLELGVDGFRLDTAPYYYHDQKLRSNPSKNKGINIKPYQMQTHIYDIARPEMVSFFQKMRHLMDQYPETTTVGEVDNGDMTRQLMTEYTSGNDRMHMAYGFELLGDDHSPHHLASVLSDYNDNLTDGWCCWSLGNHDIMRAVSRWGSELSDHENFAKLLLLFSGTLRGSLCLYQGEELGLPEADVAFEDLQDPYGIDFWPEYKGRDGCRTPMIWDARQPYGGFSISEPWLPVDPHHIPLAVDNQRRTEDSTLKFYQNFLAWRQNQQILKTGLLSDIQATDTVLSYKRTLEETTYLIYLNFSEETQEIHFPTAHIASLYSNQEAPEVRPDGTATLRPLQGLIATITA